MAQIARRAGLGSELEETSREAAIEVLTAYHQFTRFEDWPKSMHRFWRGRIDDREVVDEEPEEPSRPRRRAKRSQTRRGPAASSDRRGR